MTVITVMMVMMMVGDTAYPLRTPPEYLVTRPTRMPPAAFETIGSHDRALHPAKSPRSRMSTLSGDWPGGVDVVSHTGVRGGHVATPRACHRAVVRMRASLNNDE